MTDTHVPRMVPRGTLPPRHSFVSSEAVSVPPNPALGRYAQKERTCLVCGAVKVTVFLPDGGAQREWRRTADSAQVTTEIFCKQFGD